MIEWDFIICRQTVWVLGIHLLGTALSHDFLGCLWLAPWPRKALFVFGSVLPKTLQKAVMKSSTEWAKRLSSVLWLEGTQNPAASGLHFVLPLLKVTPLLWNTQPSMAGCVFSREYLQHQTENQCHRGSGSVEICQVFIEHLLWYCKSRPSQPLLPALEGQRLPGRPKECLHCWSKQKSKGLYIATAFQKRVILLQGFSLPISGTKAKGSGTKTIPEKEQGLWPSWCSIK